KAGNSEGFPTLDATSTLPRRELSSMTAPLLRELYFDYIMNLDEERFYGRTDFGLQNIFAGD
ncbi:MAG: hypothetical protein IJP42_07125, partial [Selenomonadaceae bacterium]|nr:hypothetical protein [Selenomonadaceae bacterium]